MLQTDMHKEGSMFGKRGIAAAVLGVACIVCIGYFYCKVQPAQVIVIAGLEEPFKIKPACQAAQVAKSKERDLSRERLLADLAISQEAGAGGVFNDLEEDDVSCDEPTRKETMGVNVVHVDDGNNFYDQCDRGKLFSVQVFYSLSYAACQEQWQQLYKTHAQLLQGHEHRIRTQITQKGKYYQVLVGQFYALSDAKQLYQRLKKENVQCEIAYHDN